MKRMLLSFVLSIAAASIVRGDEDRPMTNENVRIHEVESGHQKGKQELYVWLPDDYDTNKHYRVLCLLPIGSGQMAPGRKRFGNELDELPKLDPCNKYDIIVCRPMRGISSGWRRHWRRS